jgi:peptide/nickel transport system permease protein
MVRQRRANKLMGLITMRTHLFDVEMAHIFLLGTDITGAISFRVWFAVRKFHFRSALLPSRFRSRWACWSAAFPDFTRAAADSIIMRGCEVLMSVPQFYLLLALAAALPLIWGR